MERAEKTAKKLEDRVSELERAARLAARQAKARALQGTTEVQKSGAELFRQRAKINTIVYTKTLTPRGATTKSMKI